MNSFTYDILRKSVATQPTRVQRKWNNFLLSPVEDWSTYYSIPFLCTSASKLRSFQYRIFHRTIGTNVLLLKMGIKDHDDCFFCDSKAAFIMYPTGGGRGFFFQRLVFLYPPQGPYKFSEPPKQSAEKLIPPLPLPRNIKINICIIVNYICLKSQETCLIRTSREL